MKSFPTDVVLSLTTGILLKVGGFSEMHELIEYVAGHPVWTHELIDKPFVARLCEAVYAEHPALRDVEKFDAKGAKGDALLSYLNEYVARQVAKYGESLTIKQGDGQRTEDPLSSLERLVSQAN